MKSIGYIKAYKKETGELYRGRIDTLPFAETIVFRKARNVNSDKAPDFDVFVERAAGQTVHVGAAWKKKGKERQYLSIRIDDLSLSQELNCLGFKQDNVDAYDLVWKRQG